MNIVQVVGGPGSGKTTLVYKLLAGWPDMAGLLRVDRYLRDRLPGDGDDFLLLPTSIDWPLVMAHLDALAARRRVVMPLYNWEQGARQVLPLPPPPEQVIEPCEWLVIEGLFYVPDIQAVRLFVDAPAEVRRERSSARSTQLSASLDDAYDSVAEPAYQRHILPQRDLAHYVLDGCLDRDALADRALRYLAAHLAGWG